MVPSQNAWAVNLSGTSIDGQVAALRQIAGKETVTDLTCEVVSLAGSRDDEVRTWAAEALESAIEPQSSELPGLIALMSAEQDGEVLYWAATMLGRIGQEAGQAVSVLESCLSDSMYLPARERAAWALCQIGPAAASATTTLRRTASDAPPRLQRLATEALRVIDEAA